MDENTKNLEVKENLKEIAETLPDGAISKIATITGYSQSYVSKFFMGVYNLSKKNLLILDAANKILDDEKKFEKKAHNIVADLLNKTRE